MFKAIGIMLLILWILCVGGFLCGTICEIGESKKPRRNTKSGYQPKEAKPPWHGEYVKSDGNIAQRGNVPEQPTVPPMPDVKPPRKAGDTM